MGRFRRMALWGQVEAAVAIAFGALAVVTVMDGEWIEVFLGVDPDNGSGTLEGLVAFVTAMVSLGFALGARTAWQAVPDQAPDTARDGSHAARADARRPRGHPGVDTAT